VTAATTSAGCHRQRGTQAGNAAVRDVVVGVPRVDDADACVRDPLLRHHPRQFLGEAQAQRVLAAVQCIRCEQAGHIGRSDGAVGNAPRGRGNFQHRLEPEHPSRAGANDPHAGCGQQRCGHLVRARGARRRVDGHVDGDALTAGVGRRHRGRAAHGITDDGLHACGIDADEQLTAGGDRRALCTQAETEHFLDLHGFRGAQLQRTRLDRLGTAGHARLGAAHLHDRALRRRGAEVLVESDDAVHLGHREVEGTREGRDVGTVDVAGVMLHGVQRRHQPTGPGGAFEDDGLDGRVGRVGVGGGTQGGSS
jgi:hypothetical protein